MVKMHHRKKYLKKKKNENEEYGQYGKYNHSVKNGWTYSLVVQWGSSFDDRWCFFSFYHDFIRQKPHIHHWI